MSDATAAKLDTGRHPIHTIDLGSIVEVTWVDSERVNLGWALPQAYTDALIDRTTYRTVGYLINLTPDHALMVMNRSDSGMVGEGMVIPLLEILTVQEIGRGDIP